MNLKLFEKTRFFYIFSCVVIFILIYIPAFFVPFHSDDYSYFLKGLSFEAHLNHYLNWSGRFITDYTASILLNLFPKSIYMGINSFAFLIIMINISLIPSIIAKDKFINLKNIALLWLAFWLYWLQNPNLGQTSFWLVGSANYLWTIMWASCYVVYILYLLQNEIKLNFTKTILLVFLGLFAGLSNESTGASIVFFTFILFFVYKNQRKIILIAFLASLIGFLILLLAPGNFVRLNHRDFENWRNLSLFEQIANHIAKIPSIMAKFSLGIIVILIFGIEKFKKSNLRFHNFVFLFFITAIFSVCVFAKSPSMPPRALNTCNFFIVLVALFCVYEKLNKNFKNPIFLLFLFCGLYFGFSWAKFTYALKQTDIQAQIRQEIILQAKKNGENEIKIPDWYWTKLNRDADKFDLFHAGGAMGAYYGINNVNLQQIDFNYAILNTKPLNLPNLVKNEHFAPNAIFYNNSKRDNIYKFFDKNTLVFEFLPEKFQNFKIVGSISTANTRKQFLCELIQIKDKFYCSVGLGDFRLKHIKKIDFKFYQDTNLSYSFDF